MTEFSLFLLIGWLIGSQIKWTDFRLLSGDNQYKIGRWNGLFHHHGLPLYYSVAQAQKMDYGWNAINMKRVAHSTVEDVEIKDFTTPLYVQDSREVTIQHIAIKGYDGHQGIKVYCHTCDCLFQHIDFERVHGFRYIKGAGAVFMQPACGIGNMWRKM